MNNHLDLYTIHVNKIFENFSGIVKKKKSKRTKGNPRIVLICTTISSRLVLSVTQTWILIV